MHAPQSNKSRPVALAACATAAALTFSIFGSIANAATFTYASFNPAPAATTTTWRNSALGSGAPAATYVGYSVMADWVGGSTGTTGQWSSEGRVVLSSAAATANTSTTPTAGTLYTNAARNPQNGATNNFNTNNLEFRGGLNTNYGGGTPMFLDYRQAISGSNAQWANVRVSLYTTIDEALDVIDLGTLASGTSTRTDTYSRSDSLRWYKFTVGAVSSGSGQFLSIDTNTNTLTGGQFGAGDTHIALFSSAGVVLASNDDYSNPASQVQSLIMAGSQAASSYPAATGFGNAGANLAAGTYYLAAAPYQLVTGAGFNAGGALAQLVNGTDITGDMVIQFKTNVGGVPEPTMTGLLGGAALALTARRRRSA